MNSDTPWRSSHQLAADLPSALSSGDSEDMGFLLGRCPVCLGAGGKPLYASRKVPVLCNRLWDSRAEARGAPSGSLDIRQCESCGNIFNKDFNPALIEYDELYENSLNVSPVHRRYLHGLARDLAERHGLRGKTVVEIGCGDALLLEALSERFGNRCVGFDPSQPERSLRFESGGTLRIDQRLYVEADPETARADFVLSTHLLEHLPAPWALLDQIRNRHEPGGVRLYIEVPNGAFVLQPQGFWDLIYEHVSYFTEDSLRYVVEMSGFRVLGSGTAYGGQYLWADACLGEACPSAEEGMGLPRLRRAASVPDVAVAAREELARWTGMLAGWRSEGKSVAVWGVGSKGTTFLNMLDPEGDTLRAVDVNPRKRGKFIPVSGHRVLSPDDLRQDPPDVVIVINPLYTEEIRADLKRLGVQASVVPVW